MKWIVIALLIQLMCNFFYLCLFYILCKKFISNAFCDIVMRISFMQSIRWKLIINTIMDLRLLRLECFTRGIFFTRAYFFCVGFIFTAMCICVNLRKVDSVKLIEDIDCTSDPRCFHFFRDQNVLSNVK